MAINKVGSKGIEDGSVAAADFAPNSVTSDKLANGTITNANLSNSSITVAGTSIALGASGTVNNKFVDWQSVVVSNGSTVTTMVASKGYFVNNTSAAGLVKLPISASIGDVVAIKDYAGNFGTNSLTIQRNGHNIQGLANDSEISTNRASLVLIYVDATRGWLYTDEHNVDDLGPTFIAATGGTVATSGDFKIHTFTGDANFVVSQVGNSIGSTTVDYLVIAGGGGGGIAASGVSGGGGGAGGYRESFPNPATGGLTVGAQTYPVTVGGGGSGGPSSSANGANSVFSTITSAGGGKGAAGAAGQQGINGSAGGSGGGGGATNQNPATAGTGGSGNTPPVSPAQGTNGGNGFSFQGHSYAGGGGGGATVTGGTVTPAYGGQGGNGGAGGTSSINGTPTERAGGGGGAGRQPLGGVGIYGPASGGGGRGGQANLDAAAGSTNTGGGGGGESSGSGFAGAGGSGIVIIRYKFQ